MTDSDWPEFCEVLNKLAREFGEADPVAATKLRAPSLFPALRHVDMASFKATMRFVRPSMFESFPDKCQLEGMIVADYNKAQATSKAAAVGAPDLEGAGDVYRRLEQQYSAGAKPKLADQS